jgi:hypothetical protein
MQLLKPTDKAILGTVSESPGRNESEPTAGLDKEKIRKPSPLLSGEGSMARRNLIDATRHSGTRPTRLIGTSPSLCADRETRRRYSPP